LGLIPLAICYRSGVGPAAQSRPRRVPGDTRAADLKFLQPSGRLDQELQIDGGTRKSLPPKFVSEAAAMRPELGSRALARPGRAYWSAFWIDVKVPLRFPPTFFTTVMIAIEMPAAIRPYSIAVAPDSSRKKSFNTDISVSLLCLVGITGRICYLEFKSEERVRAFSCFCPFGSRRPVTTSQPCTRVSIPRFARAACAHSDREPGNGKRKGAGKVMIRCVAELEFRRTAPQGRTRRAMRVRS
jgi:hypothetical protein